MTVRAEKNRKGFGHGTLIFSTETEIAKLDLNAEYL